LNKREIRATSCDVDSTSYLPHGTMIIHVWPIKLRFERGNGHMLKDFYHMTTIDKTITEMREAIEDSSQRSVVELFQVSRIIINNEDIISTLATCCCNVRTCRE